MLICGGQTADTVSRGMPICGGLEALAMYIHPIGMKTLVASHSLWLGQRHRPQRTMPLGIGHRPPSFSIGVPICGGLKAQRMNSPGAKRNDTPGNVASRRVRPVGAKVSYPIAVQLVGTPMPHVSILLRLQVLPSPPMASVAFFHLF